MSDILFHERQFFRQWFIWVPLVAIEAFLLWGFFNQVFLGKPFGDNPMSDMGLGLTLGLVFLVNALFSIMHLDTEITSEGIRIAFFPFVRRFIAWHEVEKAQVREYNPISEFGGWGIRFGKNGMAYNVGGRIGLELTLKNGRRVMIGTQRDEELPFVLTRLGLKNL